MKELVEGLHSVWKLREIEPSDGVFIDDADISSVANLCTVGASCQMLFQ